jgi:hypothetical protein
MGSDKFHIMERVDLISQCMSVTTRPNQLITYYERRFLKQRHSCNPTDLFSKIYLFTIHFLEKKRE